MLETNSWSLAFSGAFKNLLELYQFLGWEFDPALTEVVKTYPVFIPKKLAQRMKDEGPHGVLAKEFMPSDLELDPDLNRQGLLDPIGDKAHFSAPQLIHRYPSRALFTPTSVCPVHCRYCFRKNELNQKDELFQSQFEETLLYLQEHSEISELIFTGGDPLTLATSKLTRILERLSEIPHLKDIRFHTRYPVILPERIDNEFISMLAWASKKFRTVSLAVHVNHEKEIDLEAMVAIQKLGLAPIQLLSQTVLLKSVNDSSAILLALFSKLLDLRVRPYYLHHPDRVTGGMHFYLSLEEGRKIYQGLRNSLPGWAIPQYVIDIPGGHGKTNAFNPETFNFSGQLLTRDGANLKVQEPDLFR